jgi:hypothetical protein
MEVLLVMRIGLEPVMMRLERVRFRFETFEMEMEFVDVVPLTVMLLEEERAVRPQNAVEPSIVRLLERRSQVEAILEG